MAVYAVPTNRAIISEKPLRKTTKPNKHRKSVEAYINKYNIAFRKDSATGEVISVISERDSND